MQDGGDSRVGSTEPAGAPVHRLTPAMIEAGAARLIDRLGFLPEMSPGIASDLARLVLEDALAVRPSEATGAGCLGRG